MDINKQNDEHKFDRSTLDMLYKRREDHLNKKTASYSVDEAFASIRKTHRDIQDSKRKKR